MLWLAFEFHAVLPDGTNTIGVEVIVINTIPVYANVFLQIIIDYTEGPVRIRKALVPK